jgi:phosphoribosylamine--glycine ligase
VAASDVAALANLAGERRVDLVVVGPEAPLAAGLVDALHGRGIRAFGPTRAAAQIESSKRFAKELMLRSRVPTARATWHQDPAGAKAAVAELGAPVVIKASGLAAGKGVAVCRSIDEAHRAIDSMLAEHTFGSAGDEVLVEEFMEGEELSLFVITDGENCVSMLPSQDHKRLQEGDAGPNTGGMGAYAPVSIASPPLLADVEDRVIRPTLRAMREHGTTFRGLLYCGLMLTTEGPKVVEFNCRFGDPETEAVLPLMRSDLLQLMLRTTEDGGLSGAPAIEFAPLAAVTTVVAAPGYPESPITGSPIRLPAPEQDTLVFHAGTKRAPDGTLVTAGGRVVAVTGLGNTLSRARELSRAGAEQVEFPGRHFRRDIAWRELDRRAGVA